MNRPPLILLSFDVEEFDMPLEYGQRIPEEEQMAVGYQGLETVMNLLAPLAPEATYFTTANFARQYPDAIRDIAQRNEIASHTFYHAHFDREDLANSRALLETVSGKKVQGLRMPRMRSVEMKDVAAAGYTYDSSVNPTYLPGRYNNRHLPRIPYRQEEMLRIPVSVSPRFRIPLFWLSFKNFPYPLYRRLVMNTLKKDGHVCLYFHPWEFVPLGAYRIPPYTKKGAGPFLQQRLVRLIKDLQGEGSFVSMERFARERCGA